MKVGCPECGSDDLYETSDQSNYDYVCKECNNRFSVDENQMNFEDFSSDKNNKRNNNDFTDNKRKWKDDSDE